MSKSIDIEVVDGNQQFTHCLTCNDRISRGGKTAKNFNTTNNYDRSSSEETPCRIDYEEKKKLRVLKKQKDRRQPIYNERNTGTSKLWDINNPKVE